MAFREYPAYKWDPYTGESRIFHKAEDVPEGWIDTHPGDGPKEPPPPKRPPVSRAEIRMALDAGHVPYQQNASTASLHATLASEVHKVLKNKGVEFDPEADVRDLLALLGPPSA